MNLISEIGSLTKKINRFYSQQLIQELEKRGFSDLRPSFLEILIFLCEADSNSIKEIGEATNLKKQTMTSHLNELEERGYITRTTNDDDRREQRVKLSHEGEKFKIVMIEVMEVVQKRYLQNIGQIEMEKIIKNLESFHKKTQPTPKQGVLL
jgi:DNA-binding MarR family transcriptional regulator